MRITLTGIPKPFVADVSRYSVGQVVFASYAHGRVVFPTARGYRDRPAQRQVFCKHFDFYDVRGPTGLLHLYETSDCAITGDRRALTSRCRVVRNLGNHATQVSARKDLKSRQTWTEEGGGGGWRLVPRITQAKIFEEISDKSSNNCCGRVHALLIRCQHRDSIFISFDTVWA